MMVCEEEILGERGMIHSIPSTATVLDPKVFPRLVFSGPWIEQTARGSGRDSEKRMASASPPDSYFLISRF